MSRREDNMPGILNLRIKDILERLQHIEECIGIDRDEEEEIEEEGIIVEDNSLDDVQAGMDALFGLGESPYRFNSLREAYVKLTGDTMMDGIRSNMSLYPEHTFTHVLIETMNRYMVNHYRMLDHSWRKFVRIRSLSDYKTIPLYKHMSNATPLYREGELIQSCHKDDIEEVGSYKPEIRAKMFILDRRVILSGDIYYIQRSLEELAHGAHQTLMVFVYSLLIGASKRLYESNEEYASLDDISTDRVYNGTRDLYTLKNAQSLHLSEFSLQEAIRRIGTHTTRLLKSYIIIPNELRYTADTLLSAYNDIECICVDNRYLGTGEKNWYLVQDPEHVEGIQLGFLDNEEEPRIMLHSTLFPGRELQHDGIQCSVSHRYGGAVVDPQALFGSFPW